MKLLEMKWPEVERRAPECVALCPAGALEQHGQHLPLGTDTMIVTHIAEQVEARCRDWVVLLPTLWMGSSHHHLGFAGTVSVSAPLFTEMAAQEARCLVSAGFRKIVDAIGTIPISFPAPAQDAFSGLHVSRAGCVRLSGQDALAYVRSRYYESFLNGRWQSDPRSDLGRIQRQQYFLRTLAHEALHTTQQAPWRGLSILDATFASLQRDPKFGFSSFRALA